jgi:hypothetical protein
MTPASPRLGLLSAIGLLALSLPAQILNPAPGEEIGRVEQISVESGQLDNLSEFAAPLWERRFKRPGASFLQLEFDRYELPPGSWVEVTSMVDMDTEVFDAEAIETSQRNTSYFNGDELRVRLFGGPLTRENFVSFKGLGVGKHNIVLSPMTICGTVDNRIPSSDARVARIILRYANNKISWCTAWLIDPQNTFVSAGHCMANSSANGALTTVTAQFGVPASTSTGGLVNPPATRQYVWLGSSSAHRRWENGGRGKDWAVFKTNKNATTDRYPGFVQGDYFRLSTILPATSSTLRVTGHGTDTTNTRNGVQQTHTGPYQQRIGTTDEIRYRVDTEGGNSGSPVIKTVGSTEYSIAVHTHGGCASSGTTSANAGTYTGRTSFVNGRNAMLTTGRCDLEPSSVTRSSPTIAPGSTFTVGSRIYNRGTIDVPETTTSTYYISTNNVISSGDTLLANFTTSKLAVNASEYHSTSVQLPSGYSAGTRYIGVYADRIGKLPELDEGNNTRSVAVTVVGALPDLTPNALQATTNALYPNLPFSIQGRVANIGTATAVASTSIYVLSTNNIISTGDTLLASFATPSLAPNQAYTRTVAVTAPASLSNGTCYLGMLVDRTSAVTELNEGNQTRSIAVQCNSQGTPDLEISAIGLTSSNLTAGGTVQVKSTTRNSGTASTGATTYTGLMLSTNTVISTADEYLGSYSVPSLAINGTRTVTTTQRIPHCVPAGTRYIAAWADYDNRVTEGSESNNTRYTAATVKASTSTLIEWRPRIGSFATNEVSAIASTTKGGYANMCINAPKQAGGWYLYTWGGTGAASGWTFSTLTGISLGILNGPILPNSIRQLNASGQGYPQLVLPANGPKFAPLRIYSRVFFFDPSFKTLTGFTTNTHYVTLQS